MSIGNPGIIGPLAAMPLAQSHQAHGPQGQAAADHARATDATNRATDAAGIGRTSAEEQAGDRDADGRRLWERHSKSTDDAPLDEADPPRQSRDATGQSGTQLDLSG